MIKTLRITLILEIRADQDDDEQVREEIKDALNEAIEDDTLEYSVEDLEEEF